MPVCRDLRRPQSRFIHSRWGGTTSTNPNPTPGINLFPKRSFCWCHCAKIRGNPKAGLFTGSMTLNTTRIFEWWRQRELTHLSIFSENWAFPIVCFIFGSQHLLETPPNQRKTPKSGCLAIANDGCDLNENNQEKRNQQRRRVSRCTPRVSKAFDT